jgi:hypothetical protein
MREPQPATFSRLIFPYHFVKGIDPGNGSDRKPKTNLFTFFDRGNKVRAKTSL